LRGKQLGGLLLCSFLSVGILSAKKRVAELGGKVGGMPETLISSTVWMKHDANKVRLQLDGVD